MSHQMTYRGYAASVELDADEGVFNGRVIGLRDVIHFQGTSVAELQHAFEEAIDDYLEWCEELGQEPEKPYSGKLLVRLGSDLHRAVALQAARRGCTQNQIVLDAVRNEVGRTREDRIRPSWRLVIEPVETQHPMELPALAGAERGSGSGWRRGTVSRLTIPLGTLEQGEGHGAQPN